MGWGNWYEGSASGAVGWVGRFGWASAAYWGELVDFGQLFERRGHGTPLLAQYPDTLTGWRRLQTACSVDSMRAKTDGLATAWPYTDAGPG